MTRLHFIQHVPFEGPGYIETYARNNGFLISGTHVYDKEAFPDSGAFDWLVIMGGPMGVYDERIYPWILGEKKFIEQAVRRNKKILGICLGAQLIANVLGARVNANRVREIGWYPVTLTGDARKTGIFNGIPDCFTAFHWHGDTFHIPGGALHIAVSDACANQAFIYKDQVIGLQFHCESTAESITGLLENCGNEITEGPFIHKAAMIRSNLHRTTEINVIMKTLLDNLLWDSSPPSDG